MKARRSILALALGLASAAAAQPFEGVVTYQASRAGAKAQAFQVSIGHGCWRIDALGPRAGQGAAIVDPRNHSTVILMAARKGYVRQAYLPRDPRSSSQGKAEVRPTGKTAIVAGYKTEEWAVNDHGTRASFWATKDLGSMDFSMDQGAQGQSDGLEFPDELRSGGYFPLRVVSHGQHPATLEAIRVEAKALEAGLFQPPPDYKELARRPLNGPANGGN